MNSNLKNESTKDLDKVKVVNSTITTKLSTGIDLTVLKQSKYLATPKRRRRLRKTCRFTHVELQHPDITYIHCLVYENGKCVLLGCRGEEEIQDALDWLSVATQRDRPTEFLVHNVVGSAKPTGFINLIDLQFLLDNTRKNEFHGYFEPELSPALVYVPKCNKQARCLLFRTGSVIITSIKTFDGFNDIYNEIKSLLC